MADLTGRRRYRAGGFFRRHLILQVEERRSSVCPYTFQDSPLRLAWRDATVEDLMTIEACHRPFPVAAQNEATS